MKLFYNCKPLSVHSVLQECLNYETDMDIVRLGSRLDGIVFKGVKLVSVPVD